MPPGPRPLTSQRTLVAIGGDGSFGDRASAGDGWSRVHRFERLPPPDLDARRRRRRSCSTTSRRDLPTTSRRSTMARSSCASVRSSTQRCSNTRPPGCRSDRPPGGATVGAAQHRRSRRHAPRQRHRDARGAGGRPPHRRPRRRGFLEQRVRRDADAPETGRPAGAADVAVRGEQAGDRGLHQRLRPQLRHGHAGAALLQRLRAPPVGRARLRRRRAGVHRRRSRRPTDTRSTGTAGRPGTSRSSTPSPRWSPTPWSAGSPTPNR